MSEAPPAVNGIDVPKVTAWFEQNIAGVAPPLDFRLIAGGRSNLTFQVTDAAGRAYVLRRPPTGHVLPTAHDMGREHRIISSLGPTKVPVAPALGFCQDVEVNGAPFYVMDFVDGLIVRGDGAAASSLTPELRRKASESIVDTLVEIHSVDPDAVGLGDLGRKEGYLARQLKRWYGQFQASKMREVPVLDEVHDFLVQRIPEQGPATIVHGDYRLDNCMIGADGSVAAVLDWELCTLGDPLADMGLMMVYWADPDDSHTAVGEAVTPGGGFYTKAELRERYAERSGRDLSHLDFYVAFGYFKLACIMDGVATRYAKGAMGSDGAAWQSFGDSVIRLGESAKQAARGIA